MYMKLFFSIMTHKGLLAGLNDGTMDYGEMAAQLMKACYVRLGLGARATSRRQNHGPLLWPYPVCELYGIGSDAGRSNVRT